MGQFKIHSKFKPSGDQPTAISTLVEGMNDGIQSQILLGVTGSGKTYTMANVIEQTQRPTLVIAHNKTLAAQLCAEFKEFFPDNAVEYFVSYYDYYQPEAYLPASDTYIEKDSSINDEIDKMRHSATASLCERRDVIVVASVSCIYSLGHPDEYGKLSLSLRPGMTKDRDEVLKKLVDIQYERNDVNFIRGTFRVRGDVLEVFPASYASKAIRVEFFGDEIDRISEIDIVTGKALAKLNHTQIFPASHYATSKEKIEEAIVQIELDMQEQVKFFEENNQLIEAQRIQQRTEFDIEMMREIGFCNGIENYSRYFDGREPGQPSYSLLDYFPDDFMLMIDESHVTVPQIRAMYAGDRSRKESLVTYGFRLPAAFDNRPLQFPEFEQRMGQTVYVSATPGPYEKGQTSEIVEQIIRPTGLIDPPIAIRPVDGQIDDLVGEIRATTAKGYRTLVTTLTKKMAENLTDYLSELDIRVKYLHSDIDTLERIEIIRTLRLGEFDVLVGINLLREGLDLPEVALVAILDADKEGFLRSETAFVQTIGRAARNVDGHVIMYADKVTGSMNRAITETNRRRSIQMEYNEKNNITPQSIMKDVAMDLDVTEDIDDKDTIAKLVLKKKNQKRATKGDILSVLEDEMKRAAYNLDFERAAMLRDKINEITERGL